MAYISQADKKELAPAIKKVLKDFGMKGSMLRPSPHVTRCDSY